MKRAWFILFSIGWVLLNTGCGDQPRIGKLSPSSVVLAFGNSLTHGTGAAKHESYPSLLSEMLGCRVINAGIPGEVTSSGLARFPDVLQQYTPDLAIICHGGNDMLGKRSEQELEQNLDAMIRAAKRAGSDVVLVGVPRPGLLLRVPKLYRRLADKHGIPLESGTLSTILRTPSLKSDQIHPNAAGYRALAQSIADLIRSSTGARGKG